MAIEPQARTGEVVEASTEAFTVQCYQLYQAPPLGALVRAGSDPATYAVVCQVTTQGADPTRRPTARGQDAPDEEAVYRGNPQLEHLLKTEFRALAVGHRDRDDVRHYLPPAPPRIHAFVYACAPDEVQAFTQELSFLEPLVAASDVSDDAVAACLRLAARCHPQPEEFLVRAGKELTVLLRGQGQRIGAVLRRLS